MSARSVVAVVSALVAVMGVAVLSAIPVSYWMGDSEEVIGGLLVSGLISIVIGSTTWWFAKPARFKLGVREGFGIVTFGWIAAALFGAIPFVVVGHLHWHDAFFETMSGFTTTGASVLDSTLTLTNGKKLVDGIQTLPKGLLYWRSMTHWFGGMGIVVLSLAILPFLGIGGQQLYNAEVPGPTSDQLTPRITNSAKILWGVYLLLSVAETLLLWVEMPLFDAWCHTCGTMATGGFSTSQFSVGGFDSVYVDSVITVFMFLAGCNFVLHFRALRGKPLIHFKNEEFRFYLVVVVLATALCTSSLLGGRIVTTTGKVVEGTLGQCFRYASFQVVSILTTTGFCTADFNVWSTMCRFLLVLLMFVGGCGGSTGGGMKNSRVLLLLKYGVEQVRRCLYPNAISNVRLNDARIDTLTLHKCLSFFFLFVSLFVGFSFVLSLFGDMTFDTAVSASIASLGNIGPGLSQVGATQTYAWMPAGAKLLLTLAMLLGRLELYTVLVVFLPRFWRR